MPKPPKIFVHVGPSKTGTTALQKYLSDHAPEGLHYPKEGQWEDSGHHILCLTLGGYNKFLRRELSITDVIEDFKEAVSKSDGEVIVSSEAFAALTYKHDDYLEKLGAFMKDCCDDVEFIYTLRHPLARAASLYKSLVCNFTNSMTLDPRGFAEDKLDNLMLGTYLTRLEKLGLPYRTIYYEPSRDYIPRFMSMIDHPIESYDYNGENVSSSDDVLPMMLCVNRLFDDQTAKRRIKINFELQSEGMSPPEPSWPFDPETVDWLSERIERDKEALDARGIEYPTLKTKPRYRMNVETQDRIQKFLTKQVKKFEGGLKPDLKPDAVIKDVIRMFS